jgi:hypothetical protein
MGWGRFALVLVVGAVLSSCGGVIDPSKNTVENFEGDLAVGGAKIFNYSWSKNGEVEVTMTAVTPTPPLPIAMYIGQSDSAGNCFQLAGYASQAIVNRTVQFGVLNKGSYCLGIYDPGVLKGAAHFTGTFSHP